LLLLLLLLLLLTCVPPAAPLLPDPFLALFLLPPLFFLQAIANRLSFVQARMLQLVLLCLVWVHAVARMLRRLVTVNNVAAAALIRCPDSEQVSIIETT
jgi:hypothetical protein